MTMTTGNDRYSRTRGRVRERERTVSGPNRSQRTRDRRSAHPNPSSYSAGRARVQTRSWSTGTALAPQPTRRASNPIKRPQEPARKAGRLGSKQVVSVRGRRTGSVKAAQRWVKIAGLIVAMLVAGIGLAMYLSGLTTQQAFEMQSLTSQESQLKNQLETLHRDLSDKSSASELAKRASELNMVVPMQPTVLGPDEHGHIVERRPGDPLTRPIVDVNSETASQQNASSRPEDTRNMADRLAAVPQGEQLPHQGPQQLSPGRSPYPPRQQ